MYKVEEIEKKKKRALIYIKIFNIFILLIIIPILVYNMVLIIKFIQNPKETPDFFGFKTYEIVSKSMENTINKNDIIIIEEVNTNELKVGDIITFHVGNEIITHRIIEIENTNKKTLYTTKGDNNKFKDKEKITFEQIEGKYVFKLNKLGHFMNFLKNKYFLVTLFLILFLSFIHIMKVKKRMKIREEKRKMNKCCQ